MPLVRLRNGKLLYYVHVPKSGGTAVEDYLFARFKSIGFLDRRYSGRSVQERWTRTPPQHVIEPIRRELLPDTLFDALFATVRHPATRLRSAFLFARDLEGTIPSHERFTGFLERLPRVLATDPDSFNGHFRRMRDLVPDAATTFRLEDGLTELVNWLDDQAGEVTQPRRVARVNDMARVFAAKQIALEPITLTPDICSLIAKIYVADYDRFGYEVIPPKEETPQTYAGAMR